MPSTEQELRLKTQVKVEFTGGLVVKPGDKLVLATPQHLSMGQAEDAREILRHRLPGVDFVFIDQCSGMAVYRADPEEASDAS